jgi:lipid A 3-O-deacylase
MKKLILLFTITLSFSWFSLQAQNTNYKSEFGFRSENDSYLAGGQDRYYTNGLALNFRTALNELKFKNKNLNKMILELEVGQKIFNPQSGSISNSIYVDRPFAGYLYGGASLNLLYQSENNLKLSLNGGTIGPASLAKEAQELMHKVIGFYEIDGWQWQVNNELAINASAEYNYLINRFANEKVDFTANSYVNIGNTFSGTGIGLTFRSGAINPLFKSATSQSRISNSATPKELTEKEFFFYAKPMLNYVIYDATIQGGLFNKDKGLIVFDAKPLVFSQQIGATYSKNRITADFSILFKTKEVKSSAKPHQYGSIALFYRFN